MSVADFFFVCAQASSRMSELFDLAFQHLLEAEKAGESVDWCILDSFRNSCSYQISQDEYVSAQGLTHLSNFLPLPVVEAIADYCIPESFVQFAATIN
jgi:hypothetical protein